ncbi:MAG: hypothetical protein JKY55_05990 [Aliivibrio sp.]|uniref:hypothetical protein n=1 Tax=Aliivibrio sp. TaxID=1872443 RepID=UPI001A41C9A4|nr:hypothetical protein [Aliivibrio sp.]
MKIKSFATKVTGTVLLAVASVSAHAGTTGEAIDAAVTGGQSNYALVVTGLIGLGAIGFGIRAIMGIMKS